MKLIKQNKGLTYLFLSIFFFYQIYLMYQGGSTYDLFDLWLGSGYIYQKLQAYFNLDFSNEIFQNELGQLDFFGYFFLFPAYVIERRINKISYNSSNEPINFLGEQFPSEDALTFFSIHLVLIIYSFFLIILIANKIENIYSRKYSIIFIISLLLVPSFSGHLLFNVKDIPHLLQLFLAKLYIYDYLHLSTKKLNLSRFLLLGFIIAASLSIRINALVFISFFLFYLYLISEKKNIYVKNTFLVAIISFLFLFIMTPQSWENPINWLVGSLEFQSSFDWTGHTLTNGEYIVAQDIDGSYLFTWYFFRMPLFIHIGFLYFIYKFTVSPKKFDFSTYALIFIFTNFALFPIIKPPAYDGLRHFLFLIPFFVILFVEMIVDLDLKKYRSIIYGLLIFYGVFTQYGLEQYKYTYFNELTNLKEVSYHCENIDGCGNWITDYWSFSGRELSTYVNQNFNEKNILICKPHHSFKNYIELDRFNEIYPWEIKPEIGEFLVVSSHRPRLNQDSCGFLEYEINYECSEVFTLKKTYRFTDVNMSYLNKCTMKNLS